ncbi:unnamed protein product [Coregonus sp. 'balchen']|nr:unnamed protein product [Coregonus sp. 'balchen']
MSRAQAESVIKNIIREIAQECAGKGHAVSETLVAFMALVWLVTCLRSLSNGLVIHVFPLQLCVDKLVDQGSPALDTIKMQVYFDMNYTSRREFIEEHQRVLQSRLVPVSREITDSRVKTREDLEGLYHKIVSYVLLCSGLGSPTDITTVREATAALQSVFPQSELGTFMSLIKKEKEQQLNDLSMIVTGIRLFNKDSRKGGEGIDDLPAILNEAIPSTSKDIEWELELSQRLAWQYTAWLERLLDPEVETRECIVPLDMLKQALYNVRQHEAFLKVILADVILCAKQVETLQTELATHEMVLLSILGNMMENLQPFLAAQSQLFPDENRIDPYEIKTQEWLLPETTANFDKLPLQYNGICGYTLVKKDGLLLPGNPSIGVLKHREKYYVFSSKEAALRFGSKPDEYIAHVAEKAKRSPELIQLLQLHQQFACVTPYSEMRSGERLLVKPITKCDSSTQTDTHLLETNIVKSYEWNEWELRRKAIKLANLRGKVTHSMQTNLSHMRRDNVTQTYLPKDVACQSKRDGKSNVPKPQVYLAGLRGGKTNTTHMIKTNLTRSVDD